MQGNTTFKGTYNLERRKKMYEDGQNKNKDHIIVIVEKEPKCKALPDLKHCRFSIAGDQKVMEVCDAIRKRIIKIDKKYENQSFFLFTNKVLPNKQMFVKDLYNTHKDPQDQLLYLMYSNLDPYGWQ